MTLPFATQQLDTRGEFFPFGAAIDETGAAEMVAGDPALGERPSSAEVLDTIVEGLRRNRDRLRAAAVVTDVRHAGGDAVRVDLEHREGQAIAVLLPYKKKRFGRGIEYGSLTAAAGVQRVWSA